MRALIYKIQSPVFLSQWQSILPSNLCGCFLMIMFSLLLITCTSFSMVSSRCLKFPSWDSLSQTDARGWVSSRCKWISSTPHPASTVPGLVMCLLMATRIRGMHPYNTNFIFNLDDEGDELCLPGVLTCRAARQRLRTSSFEVKMGDLVRILRAEHHYSQQCSQMSLSPSLITISNSLSRIPLLTNWTLFASHLTQQMRIKSRTASAISPPLCSNRREFIRLTPWVSRWSGLVSMTTVSVLRTFTFSEDWTSLTRTL